MIYFLLTIHGCCSFLQLRIKAYDSVYPSNTDEAVVTINVNHNPSAPVFNPAFYVTTIPETFLVSNVVVDINAVDNDRVSFSPTSASV